MKSGKNSVWDRCPKCGTTVEIELPDTRHPRERRRDLRRGRWRWLKRIGVLLLLVCAGLNGWMVMRYSEELQAVDKLEDETEGQITITTAPIGPLWLKRWLISNHLPFPQTVFVVNVENRDYRGDRSETTDRFLELAGNLPGLCVLDIGGSDSSDITDQGMTHLRNMRLLRLNIGSPNMTDTGLYYLRNMTSLRYLTISESPQLTDKGIAYLVGLKNMEGLEIHDVPLVTDAGMAAFRDMPKLDRLSIGGPHQLTGEGFVHLEGLKNLVEFEIRDAPQLTDVALAHLENIPSLAEVKISGASQLTDEGFAHLAGLKNLQRLEIRDAPRLTKKGIAGLRSSLPNTDIDIDGETVEAEE